MNEDALYRVLRSLASLGIFEEIAPREFSNNAAASLLRSDVPGSFYDMALWMTDPFHLQVYAGFPQVRIIPTHSPLSVIEAM
jgi:hypothetical protein